MACLRLRNPRFFKSLCSSQIEISHNCPSQLRQTGSLRGLQTSGSQLSSVNSDYTISPVYHNRNPRNLERLAFARKRVGWEFQSPRKDYYHKLVLQKSARHTSAWVEHFSGKVIVSAATTENAILSQLNSPTDVSACENIGRVLAQRCLESGITAVFYDDAGVSASSERVSIFLQAFKDVNISLSEPETKVPEFAPGVTYDGYNRYDEPKVWQENYQKL